MNGTVDTGSDEYIIGQNIRKYRKLKGWTQADLFEATGIERADISKYEGGTKGMPTIPVLKTFAEGLGVSIGELTEGIGCSSSESNSHDAATNYKQLSPENQAMVNKMIEALLLQQRAATV